MSIAIQWSASVMGFRAACVASVLLVSGLAVAADTTGTLGKGTPWEMNYSVRRGTQPGPVVVIRGGTGEVEPAAAAAARQIRSWPIVRGTLVVLDGPREPASAPDPSKQPGSKVTDPMETGFPRSSRDATPRGEQPRAVWRWLESLHAAWVIDLREATSEAKVVAASSQEADQAAASVLATVNAAIERPECRFSRGGSMAEGTLTRAAADHLAARALVLSTSVTAPPVPKGKSAVNAGSNKKATTNKSDPKEVDSTRPSQKAPAPVPQPISRRTRQQRIMVQAVLAHLKMIDPRLNIDLLPGRETAPHKAWVALYDAGGTGGGGASSLTRLLGTAGMNVVRVGAEEIGAGTLQQFHLVIFPGGSGSGESAAIGETGRNEVRQFVEHGGGYMGICAGAYLSLARSDRSLRIFNAKTVSPYWERGGANLKMELTPEGRKILGDHSGLLDVRYHNGPVVCPAEFEGLPEYEVLAYFRTEINGKKAPAGLMIGSPAIATGKFGQGRVMFISPHPEQTPSLEDLVVRAAQWAAGRP